MKALFFTVLLLFVGKVKSQDKDACIHSQKIVIDIVGNILPFSNVKHFIKDTANNFILYYPDKYGNKSFWYEFDVRKKCELSFLIKPLGSADRYNFFVYKDTLNGPFCEKVFSQKILPVRTNLMKGDMSKGTGLSNAYDSATDTSSVAGEKWEQLYLTAYQKPLIGLPGEKYYVNVYHVQGQDCGHLLEVSVQDYKENFVAVDKKCFKEEVHKVNKITPVLAPDMIDFNSVVDKKFANKIFLTGEVRDTFNQQLIPCDLNYLKGTKEEQKASSENGIFQIVLDNKLFYEIIIGSVGYQEKKIKVMKQTMQNEVKDLGVIYLNPLKEGQKFVLNDIYFYSGTYAFKSESDETLKNLLNYLKKHELVNIEIHGHTNGKGVVKRKKKDQDFMGPEWNFKGNEKKLSKLRAEAVEKYLVNNKIAPDRIESKGFGDSEMLYEHPRNKEERDLNKRVEVLISSISKK